MDHSLEFVVIRASARSWKNLGQLVFSRRVTTLTFGAFFRTLISIQQVPQTGGQTSAPFLGDVQVLVVEHTCVFCWSGVAVVVVVYMYPNPNQGSKSGPQNEGRFCAEFDWHPISFFGQSMGETTSRTLPACACRAHRLRGPLTVCKLKSLRISDKSMLQVALCLLMLVSRIGRKHCMPPHSVTRPTGLRPGFLSFVSMFICLARLFLLPWTQNQARALVNFDPMWTTTDSCKDKQEHVMQTMHCELHYVRAVPPCLGSMSEPLAGHSFDYTEHKRMPMCHTDLYICPGRKNAMYIWERLKGLHGQRCEAVSLHR